MKSILGSIAAGAAVTLLGASALAQSNSLATGTASKAAPVSNPSQTLTSLHAEAIIPVLVELGIEHQGATLPNGQKVILATADNGLRFQVTPTACDETASLCKGVNFLALFNTRAQERVISSFNYRYAFVSTGLDQQQNAYISRYDIADYGMPKGNLAVSVKTFLYMASLFDRHLFEATNTVSLDASHGDMAEHGLNMQQVLADRSLADATGLSLASHRVSLETLPDVVDTFVRADALAPGRIVNEVKGRK